jgi:hypothetical protein
MKINIYSLYVVVIKETYFMTEGIKYNRHFTIQTRVESRAAISR